MTVDEWAESDTGMVLSPRTSSVHGPIRLRLTPYARFPMRLFTDPTVERIGLCWAEQMSKTTIVYCCAGYAIDRDPGPMMFFYPTQHFAKVQSKERIQPTILDCPSLRRHLTGNEDDFQLLTYTLDRMTVHFGWAGSEVMSRSHSIRYTFIEESSANESGSSMDVEGRGKTYWNRKMMNTTTPRMPTDSIWRMAGLKLKNPDAKGEELWSTSAWEPTGATSVYFHEVCCPNCRTWIRLEFCQIRWPEDLSIRDLKDKGWYECQVCQWRITDNDKLQLLQAGRWTSPNPGHRWVWLHLSSLYGPWDSQQFGEIASRAIRARKSQDPETIRDFVNKDLALPYTLEQSGTNLVTPDRIELAQRWGYQRNEIPRGVKVLVVGADVRNEQVHWVILGLGAAGEVWTIAWGIYMDLHEFETFVTTKVYNHPDGWELRPTYGGIDCRFKMSDVIEMCRRLAQAGFAIRAVRGETKIIEHGTVGPLPWKPTPLDRDSQGKPLLNSLIGYRINTMYWKGWLYGRLNRKIDEAHPENTQPDLFHLPTDRDKIYESHLQSEQAVQQRKRGTTQLVTVWVLRKGFEANHYLDSNVYALSMAHCHGLMNLTTDSPIYGTRPADHPDNKPKPEEPAKPSFIKRGFKIR